jgi:N-acyl-D-aspartate/D-glutamate deacylase
MKYDLIIKNGLIVDGTGIPAFRGGVAVKDGVIREVGVIKGSADREIDAKGGIIAPGHIDSHTHYDGQIFWDPTCSNAGENGITTVVMANCGFGFAPCKPEERERAMMMMETTEQIPAAQLRAALPWDWESLPDFLDSLRRTRKAVNAMMYMPSNLLMLYVMGVEGSRKRRPTQAEMARMKALTIEAMDAGAIGISISSMGLTNNHVDIDGSPMPTDVAHIDDLCELVSVLRERGDGIVQVVSQVGPVGNSEISIRLAEASGRPVIHNVFSTSDYRPDLHRKSMAWLDDVLKRGLTMFAQALVNRAWNEQDMWNCPANALDTIPVHRVLNMDTKTLEAKMALAANEEYRARFRNEYSPVLLEAIGGGVEGYTVIGMGKARNAEALVGRTIGDIAAERGNAISDVYLDLCLESNFDLLLKTNQVCAKDPTIVAELLSHSHVLAGTSDGGAHSKLWSGAQWTTDLLIWMVRETGLRSLEQMHYSMSYLPARALGLRNRGAILEGMGADILVYDLQKLYFDRTRMEIVHDLPNNDWRRRVRAGGYDFIIVNGVVTYENDRYLGTSPGRLLGLGDAGMVEPKLQLKAAG